MHTITIALLVLLAAPPAKDAGSPQAIPNCTPVVPGKKIIRLHFKPDTAIMDFAAMFSSMRCVNVVYREQDLRGKKFTVTTRDLLTIEELEALFLGTLDSVGLRGVREGQVIRIVIAGKK